MKEKDALHVLWLLRSVPIEPLAAGLRRLHEETLSTLITAEALQYLKELFSAMDGPGSQMVVRATEGIEDPIGFSAGPNLFTYVHDQPTNFVDPFGLVPPGDILACLNAHPAYCADVNYPTKCVAQCAVKYAEDCNGQYTVCEVQCQQDANKCLRQAPTSCTTSLKEIWECIKNPSTKCVTTKPIEGTQQQ